MPSYANEISNQLNAYREKGQKEAALHRPSKNPLLYPKRSFLVSLLVFLAMPAHAELKRDIAKCAGSKTDASRLICYDKIATDLKVDAPRIDQVAGSGKWKVKVETSPIDDSKNVVVTLDADTAIRKRNESSYPTLILRCKEKKLEGYIAYEIFIGSSSTRVLIRFDKAPARSSSWSISSDHKAVFIPGSVSNFVKEMQMTASMLVELTPYSESPVMTTFDVRGLQEAAKELKSTCPWK